MALLALSHGMPSFPDALCCKLDVDIEFFFSEDPDEIEIAQSTCSFCLEKQKCLDWAIKMEWNEKYKWGVYGGLTPEERP